MKLSQYQRKLNLRNDHDSKNLISESNFRLKVESLQNVPRTCSFDRSEVECILHADCKDCFWDRLDRSNSDGNMRVLDHR